MLNVHSFDVQLLNVQFIQRSIYTRKVLSLSFFLKKQASCFVGYTYIIFTPCLMVRGYNREEKKIQKNKNGEWDLKC